MQKFCIKTSVVRLISHRQIEPRFFIKDALCMGKRIKACLAVVCTHTALSDPAEAHFAGGKMNYNIVYTTAAEGNARGDIVYIPFVL